MAFDHDALEAGRLLFAREGRFVAGAGTVEALPPPGLPEVAFAGRSNVGKSSLINAITGRKELARVSKTPGRTQQINFFDIGGRLMLVDLPGYGYAQQSKQKIAAWTDLIFRYLKGRVPLHRVCLLIDGRHGPKPSDQDVMAALDAAAVVFQVILTKVDEVNPKDLGAVENATRAEVARHGAGFPDVLRTSARAGSGIPELRAMLSQLAAQ